MFIVTILPNILQNKINDIKQLLNNIVNITQCTKLCNNIKMLAQRNVIMTRRKKKNEGVVYTYISPNFVQTIEFFHNILDDVFHAFHSSASSE